MSLYIASLNTGFLKGLVSKNSILGFIPTAGNVYNNPYFVVEDEKRIKKIGCTMISIDFDLLTRDQIADRLSDCDIVFCAGGNTFYLMQQIEQKGIKNLIKDFAYSDKIFVGASAGGAIFSPSIEPFKTLDDISAAPNLSSMDGLAFNDYVVLPHYGKPKYLPNYHSVLTDYCSTYRFVLLRDDEYIKCISPTDYIISRTSLL